MHKCKDKNRSSLKQEIFIIITLKIIVLYVFIHFFVEKPKHKPTTASVEASLLSTNGSTQKVQPSILNTQEVPHD